MNRHCQHDSNTNSLFNDDRVLSNKRSLSPIKFVAPTQAIGRGASVSPQPLSDNINRRHFGSTLSVASAGAKTLVTEFRPRIASALSRLAEWVPKEETLDVSPSTNGPKPRFCDCHTVKYPTWTNVNHLIKNLVTININFFSALL